MSKVIIGKFGPSARQILDAALHVASKPQVEVIVGSRPEGGTVLGGAEWGGRRKKDYDRGLSYLHDLAKRTNLVNQVFLGGACDPTTWRKDVAAPLLKQAGCAFYDPQVPDWDAQDAQYKAQGVVGGIMEVEATEKTASYVLLFVFDPLTRAIATLNEAVEFMMAGGRQVVLVASYVAPGQEIAGQTLTTEEAMDLNIARAELFGVAKAKGIPVYSTIEEAVHKCIEVMQEAAQDYQVVSV